MAGIQSLGIGSGLLTSDLVDQLVAAERAVSDLRLNSQTARVEAKISAYGELRTVMQGMQSSISSLSLSSTIQGTSARSSNESVLKATTNSTAEPGTYRIEVDEIAASHSLATKRFNSIDDTIGTGTLTFKFGTTEYDGSDNYSGFEQAANSLVKTLEINSGNNSLGGIRDAINNGDFGVGASVVYDGTGYRLLLTSEKTGKETSMEITATGDAGLQALAYNSAQNDPDANMVETQRGSDAALRINGLAVTSTTNTLDQVVRGVSINLTEASTSGVTLSITRDTSEIADKIESFIEKYNDYKTVYDELIKYNPDDQVGGILLGDNVLRTVQSQLRSGLTQIINGIGGSTYSSLIEIGIRTDQNNDFKLAFDRSKFEAAMNIDARSITGLLATDRQATDAQIRVVTVGGDTKPGSYDVSITQAATQGKFQGLSTPGLGSSSTIISDVNDNFSLNVDGTTRSVSLVQGSYDSGDDLALMMQNSINQAFTGQSVTVTFDSTNQRFDITSSRFGANSQVSVTSVDPQTANTLGLNVLGGGQAVGSYFSTLSDASFAAATTPGTKSLDPTQGVNFEANPVSFDIILGGTLGSLTRTISLDENWGNILDTSGNIATERDRSDVLTYIQSQLNTADLAGIVKAEFNSSDRLVFRTEPAAGNQTLEISNASVTGSDFLGITNGIASSGVSVAAGTSFELQYSNRYGTVNSGLITVPEDTYETAEQLATAIQSSIDTAIGVNDKGAMTEKGSRSLPANFDFTADRAQFVFAYNGDDYEVTVDAQSGTSTLESIQAAIDASLTGAVPPELAGAVVASLSSNGLVLTTNEAGSSETLEIKRDGAGATTTTGGVDLSTGTNFSLTPAAFKLVVDGTEINVNVNGDGTQGSNDGESNLSVIQQALDTALAAADGGGVFSAGDVVAKLDATNRLYFETVSKNGTATQATFGARATISIADADANATASLGLANGAGAGGFDGFGLAKGVYTGFDSQSTVTYQKDEQGRGRFVIAFDNATNVSLSNVSLTATTQLGLADGNGAPATVEKGKDVEGTINGIKATGRGQLLTASEGNQAASNGYVLGGAGWDFGSAAVIDGTNNTLKVTIDGTESGTISLTAGAYSSGAQLAAELKAKINADATLLQANKAVDVQYDANTGIFGIFSVSTGSQSSAKVSEITAGGVAIFGLTTSSAVVNGKDAVGAKDDASGIVLRVTGDRTGDRGSVSYVEGIMAKLDKFFESMLGRNGLVTEKETGLKKEEDNIKEERSLLDQRTAVFEARLRSKFLFNDKLISQLKTTEDFLVRQFDAMNASMKDR